MQNAVWGFALQFWHDATKNVITNCEFTFSLIQLSMPVSFFTILRSCSIKAHTPMYHITLLPSMLSSNEKNISQTFRSLIRELIASTCLYMNSSRKHGHIWKGLPPRPHCIYDSFQLLSATVYIKDTDHFYNAQTVTAARQIMPISKFLYINSAAIFPFQRS